MRVCTANMDGNQQWVRVGKYRADPRLLEKRPVARCLIRECQAACCSHGVYVDVGHATQIIDEAELIKPHLAADRLDVSTWFEGAISEDGDFPTGYKVGTNVVQLPQIFSGTRYVFLRNYENLVFRYRNPRPTDSKKHFQEAAVGREPRHNTNGNPSSREVVPLGSSARLERRKSNKLMSVDNRQLGLTLEPRGKSS